MRHIALVILGLLASACTSAPAPLVAQQPDAQESRTLSVTADAVVHRAPDRAVVRFGVESVSPAARDATRQNADAMSAVLAALADRGIPDHRIRTEAVSLQPRVDREPGQEPRITGFQASNRIRAVVLDIDAIGAVIDAAVDAGANRVLGIQFEIADPEAAYHEALQQAIAMARRDAEVAAAALDEHLGPALRVSTSGFTPRSVRGASMETMRVQASSTPVQPGELEVSAHVSITYRIGQ